METKKKIIQRIVLGSMAALVVMSAAGCAEEVASSFSDRTKVEIVPVLEPMEGVVTRAADGLNDNTNSAGFSCLYAASPTTTASPNSLAKVMIDDNASNYTAYSYQVTSATTLTVVGEAPTFPAGENSVNVYGWYPYTADNSFSIQTNQSTTTGYCLSDLMLADKVVCTRDASSVTPAPLAFRHVMSKVKIVLTPGAGVTVTDVALKNVKPTVAIDASTVTALTVGSASGDAGDVTLLSSGSLTSSSTAAERTLCGVFPAQTISSSFITVTAEIDGIPSTITYSFDAGSKTFVSAKEYTVNISVSATQTGSPTVSLADWTGAEGTVNIGAGGGGGSLALSQNTLTLTAQGTTGSVTISGSLSVSSSMTTSFNVQNSAYAVATISTQNNTITVTPLSVGSTTITVTDVNDNSNVATCVVSVVAPAGLYYNAVTSDHIGYVVCTDGRVFETVAQATAQGSSPLGMLIYVGSHTGKTTSGGNTNTSQTVSCTNGVIAALQDAGTDSDRMYNNTLPTNNNAWTARDYTSTAITSLGSWVSATDNDWKDFMVACSNAYIAQGLSGATVTADSNTPVAFWALMERCGGTGATAVVAGGQHWTNCGVSSPSYDTTYSWPYFSDSEWAVASDGYYYGRSLWNSSNGAQGSAVRAVRAF